MKEIWKEYKPDYFGSTLGRIKSLKWGKEKILKMTPDKDGYLQVTLFIEGKQKTFKVHRIVAELFIENPEGKPAVNHIDGDKQNNFVENLEWVTRSENMRHAYDMGLKIALRGEDRSDSKLTNEQVIYIRNNPDGLTGKELAAKFGVTDTVIGAIQLGKCRKSAGGKIRELKSRLSEKQREEIRTLRRTEGYSYAKLGEMFGVNAQTAWNIVHEK